MGTRQAGIIAWLRSAIVSTSSSLRDFVESFSPWFCSAQIIECDKDEQDERRMNSTTSNAFSQAGV
jgi:hypothetical protein